jgi:hypothetical protein
MAGTWKVMLVTDKGPTNIGGRYDVLFINGKAKLEAWNLDPESQARMADRKPLTQ